MGEEFQSAHAEGRGPIRIVLIDDSETALRNITGFLRTMPRVTVLATVTSGAEAVALARQLRPDLVLLDVEMPEMNGFEACRKMLASDPDTCVVMISVHRHDHLREACLATGARNFITKTRLAGDLPPIIAALLGKANASEQLEAA